MNSKINLWKEKHLFVSCKLDLSSESECGKRGKRPRRWTMRVLDRQKTGRTAEGRTGRQADRQQSTDKRAPNDSQKEGNISMQQLSLAHFLFVLVLAKPITSGWVGDF